MKILSIVRLLLVLALLAPALSGCPAGVYGSIVTPEQLSLIVRGKTTKAELAKILGEPDNSRSLGNGKEELSYERATVGTHYNFGSYGNYKSAEFWVVLKNNVVEAYGERDIE